MQQDALAHTEDFGGPDRHQATHAGRSGTGHALPELHARSAIRRDVYAQRRNSSALCRARRQADDASRWKSSSAASRPASCPSCIRASPSPSIATTRRPSGSSPPICCRASSPPAEWARIEARPEAAHPGAQPFPARHLQRRAGAEGRRRAALDDLRLQALPARDARAAGAARRLCQCLRQRSGAQRGRRLRRAGRQSARALGRLLHAGQPRRGAARLSRRVPRHGRARRSSIIRCELLATLAGAGAVPARTSPSPC